ACGSREWCGEQLGGAEGERRDHGQQSGVVRDRGPPCPVPQQPEIVVQADVFQRGREAGPVRERDLDALSEAREDEDRVQHQAGGDEGQDEGPASALVHQRVCFRIASSAFTSSAFFWHRTTNPVTSRSPSTSPISAARVSSARLGYHEGCLTTCHGSTALERSIAAVMVLNASLSCCSSWAPRTMVTELFSSA